ncbi:MAG: STAS domain-containing protein [Anaerolineales bacterium]|nr:STAS domain-containing protein [Anaerolineales bacterium]
MILVSPVADDIWVVAPDGRLDLTAAGELEEALTGLLNEGRSRLVVDCSTVTYIASAGLRVLVIALHRARNLNGDFRLAGVSGSVQQVLRMSGLEAVFTIHPTLAEAVAALKAGTMSDTTAS